MLEGRVGELRRQERQIANWMAPLLSATSGQAITPAQLLGEEESAMTMEQRVAEGERKLAKLMRKMKKARS